MSNLQDWYLGQIVRESEMDTIYTDLNDAERNLAVEGSLSQGPVAQAHIYGGILSGLVVSFDSATSVAVTLGTARDGNGKRIALPEAATVSLLNLGDTPEGEVDNVAGDGALTASSITGEAWLSLFIAYDVALSDTRTDALNEAINYRQEESFHFELLLGADAAAPATARPNLAATRVLLADILLDSAGEIREISTIKAICNSTSDFNAIGYGPEDTAALYGRRGDWIAIDSNGTTYPLLAEAYDDSKEHDHAYHNIRAGSPRAAIEQLINLYAEPGTASKAGGSEVIGGRPITGKALSSPGAAAALDMPSGSIHTQLEALYDKVNTLLSRGTDQLTGNMVITGTLIVGSDLTAAGDTLLKQTTATLYSGKDGLIVTPGAAFPLANIGANFLSKRKARRYSDVTTYVTNLEDALGLPCNQLALYDQAFVIPKVSPTEAEVESYLPGWNLTLGGAGAVLCAQGWENRGCLALSVLNDNDLSYLNYGYYGPYNGALASKDRPVMLVHFYAPAAGSNWSYGVFNIQFKSYNGSLTKRFGVTFGGAASGMPSGSIGIDAFIGTDSGGDLDYTKISALIPEDDVLYSVRVCLLDTTHALINIYKNGASVGQTTVTYDGATPFVDGSDALTPQLYLVNIGGSSNQVFLPIHRVAISGIINPFSYV